MKKIVGNLSIKKLSLRRKLILYFSLIVIVPIIIILVFIYINQAEETEKNAKKSTQVIVHQAAKNFSYYIKDANELINSIFLNESIKEQILIVNNPNSNVYEKIVAEENVQNQLKSFVRTKDYIRSFYIIDNEGNTYQYGRYTYGGQIDFNELNKKSWFVDVYTGKKKKVYKALINLKASEQNLHNDEDKIVILMRYTDNNMNEQLGVIGIEIKYDVINTLLKDLNEYPNSKTLIIDSENNVFGTDQNYQIHMTELEQIRQNDSGEITTGNNLIVYETLGLTGWKLVQISDLGQILSAHRKTIRMTLFVGFLFLIIAEVMAVGMSYQISKPINDLIKQIMKIEIGEFDSKVEITKEDEIGQLSHRFNQMVVKIEEQIKRIQRDEKEKREIEMRLLQEQINPHFLYNTLSSMVWLSRIKKMPKMTAGLKSLIFILKNIVHDGDEYITIGKEIEFIKNYIVIHKLRYGERFDVEFFVDEKIKDFKILKLLIQPIIENSILHGFEYDGYDNKINIYVKKDNDNLEICVEDNGIGMSEEEIEDILNNEKSRDEGLHHIGVHHIGVHNIIQRLNLHYGKQSKLWIESVINKGTRFYIIIPIVNRRNT